MAQDASTFEDDHPIVGAAVALFDVEDGKYILSDRGMNELCQQMDALVPSWELPLAARLAGADVLHAPANTGPRLPLTRTVLTVHDLIPLEIDSDSPATRKWVRRVRAAARAARQRGPAGLSGHRPGARICKERRGG